MEVVKERISLVGNINNPETLFSKGPEDVRGEVYKNLESGVQLVGPECAIPLQTAIENLKEIPQSGAGLAQGTCELVEKIMAEITDIQNEIIVDEIEEFIERPDERERTINTFAQTTLEMQDIAAALIDGDNGGVDEMTKAALDVRHRGTRNHG